MRTGIFPGTFDPVTEGHLDIVRRATKVLDRLVVAVAEAYHKDTVFDASERKELVRRSLAGTPGVDVVTFDGLLVDLARREGASVIVRGMRFVTDFEYELQLALMNRRLDEELETLFFIPSEKYSYLNSSVIKEVVRLGGDVSQLVPEPALAALKRKLRP
ncbi:MAG TPA: pantetheine-phosphate adenylyltransferase [Candidatus Eisenbacteria bacterium]|nr:pantetheine-phosphate adenylyltransferase [Candidatus Eisenbacteria bacterium]